MKLITDPTIVLNSLFKLKLMEKN